MQVAAGIGGAANGGIQYVMNGTINPTDVLIASYVGALTANLAFAGNVIGSTVEGGMAMNAAIGMSVNSLDQLRGNHRAFYFAQRSVVADYCQLR